MNTYWNVMIENALGISLSEPLPEHVCLVVQCLSRESKPRAFVVHVNDHHELYNLKSYTVYAYSVYARAMIASTTHFQQQHDSLASKNSCSEYTTVITHEPTARKHSIPHLRVQCSKFLVVFPKSYDSIGIFLRKDRWGNLNEVHITHHVRWPGEFRFWL